MTKGKGYLLPSGDATENELECCLVFYPKRDEYRRALMGSLDYLATWIAWERDTAKRGKDAAASWKLANIQTWECCNMGFCDNLQTTLDALLAATTGLECCGDQDITDGRQFTDEVLDGVGDVPQNIIDAGYAANAADWDGFDDYKCMISHLAVDHVESFFREIAPHISDTGIVIGGIGVVGALVGAILTLVGLPISAGIIIALGAAAAIWTWITSEGRDAVEDLADEIALNHDALACAIYKGDGVTESVTDFNAEVDALFTVLNATGVKAINLEPQLRAMYAGRYDQEDVAQKLADLGYDLGDYICSCATIYDIDITYNFTTGKQGFVDNSRAAYVVAGTFWNLEDGFYLNSNNLPPSALVDRLVSNVLADAGFSITGSERFYIEFMEFDWWPGSLVVQQGRFYAEGSFVPDDFDYQVQGTYSKEWDVGTEPQLANAHSLGFTSPQQGGPNSADYVAFVYSLRIAGHIAEIS